MSFFKNYLSFIKFFSLGIILYPKIMCNCLHNGNVCFPLPFIGNLMTVVSLFFGVENLYLMILHLSIFIILPVIAVMLENRSEKKDYLPAFFKDRKFLRTLALFFVAVMIVLVIDWIMSTFFFPLCLGIE